MQFRAVLAGMMGAALMSSMALAAASFNELPQNDPTAANLTKPQIQKRAYDACLITQARVMSTTQAELRGPCNCYARGTIRAMGNDEVAAFRATGYFSDATRVKALGFVDSCKLKRPI
jgi:hypothetical protein